MDLTSTVLILQVKMMDINPTLDKFMAQLRFVLRVRLEV